MSMFARLLSPMLFGSTVSIGLYLINHNLNYMDYMSPVAYWVCVGRPIGHIWLQRILKPINFNRFPVNMVSYRQLFLVDKKAIIYDAILNQTLFGFIATFSLIAWTHAVILISQQLQQYYKAGKGAIKNVEELKSNEVQDIRNRKQNEIMEKLSIGYQTQTKTSLKPFLAILACCAMPVIKLRTLVGFASISSEYWISYLGLDRSGEQLRISQPTKRLLFLKQLIIKSMSYSATLQIYYHNAKTE